MTPGSSSNPRQPAGEPLDAIIAREGPQSVERTVDVARQVLRSLATAHAAGVYHGDLRAGHVLIGARDAVTVSGYGGAPAVSAGGAEAPSAPNDVRAVGLLMCEMLTGRIGATLPNALDNDRVARAIERALRANPEDRFQTAAEMKKALGESGVKRAMDVIDDIDDAQDVLDLIKGKSGSPRPNAASVVSRGKLLKLGLGGLVAGAVVISAVTLPRHEAEPPRVVALAPEPPPAPGPSAPAPARAPAPASEPEPTPPPATAPPPEAPLPVKAPPEPKAQPAASHPKPRSPEHKPAPPPPEPPPAPAPPAPEPELTTLSFDQINGVMRTSIDAVARCMRPIPAGTTVEIPVRITLASDGSVRAARMDHPKADCIRPIVEALRFPTFTRPSQTFMYTYRSH